MLEIPTDLPADLVPLSWLIGVWEGTGVIDYEVSGTRVNGEFAHRVSFSHDGGPYLNYSAEAWMLDDAADDGRGAGLVSELGYWRVARPVTAADAGPALLPPTADAVTRTADDVELLRTPEGGFPLQVALVHADAISELYLGQVNGPRIDIATDAIVRPEGAKEYAAATRMYGLVEGHLLWAWDIAALGSRLGAHASARLAKVD
ncbi:fatty acid-binding protein [Microbacterium mangrovi]|uniref:Peroxynitrite isomerase n=1 Tax=Microbacterium mangrovi TaxID=1348253 RepID=A0A0B2A391_9MICO|nr:FABP family protein [Microbacterium mangrovi]KHK96229.1 fatty acid-binding protein [Microbacterium mangrovi]